MKKLLDECEQVFNDLGYKALLEFVYTEKKIKCYVQGHFSFEIEELLKNFTEKLSILPTILNHQTIETCYRFEICFPAFTSFLGTLCYIRESNKKYLIIRNPSPLEDILDEMNIF